MAPWSAASRIRDVAVRADGTMLALDEEGVTLLNVEARGEIRRFQGADRWSPDGDWVAGATSADVVSIWEVGTQAAPIEIRHPSTGRGAVAVSNAGRHIAVAHAGGAVAVIQREPRRTLGELRVEGTFRAPHFVDDHVLLVVTQASFHVCDASTVTCTAEIPERSAYLKPPWRIWQDGRGFAIARAASPEAIRAIDLQDVIARFYVTGPIADHRGERFAYTMGPYPGENRPSQVVIHDLATGAALMRWPDVRGALAFSPDGSRLIAAADRRVGILDLASRTEVTPR
jgi:hypothetical protein